MTTDCTIFIKHSKTSCRVTLRNREGNELILNEFSKSMRGVTYPARARRYAEGVRIVTGAPIKEVAE